MGSSTPLRQGYNCNKFRELGKNYSGTTNKKAMLLVQGEILQVDRQELLNATTAEVKDIWLGNALSLSDQGMQRDPGIPAGQAQTIISHNAAFQTEDLNTYDSDCDDLSTAQAVLMANISNYGFDVISEVPNFETCLNDMDNQSVHALKDFEQSPVIDFTDNEISSEFVNASLKKVKFHLTQFDSVVKKRTTPNALEEGDGIKNAVEIQEYFKINDLKARIQDKDKTICKLKDTIKSLRENTKEENVNHDKCDLEPINKELENSVAKLLSKNGRMFKLDLVPLPPRLLQNRDVHIDYLKHTQEQANTLREIVEQAKAKQPLDRELDFACKYATRIQELLVYVQDTCPITITPSTKKC
ncbi:hypothetical protein Tco_0967498 [Tanacetum coccineum]